MLDCIIIGGGPAGITASIYLKRAGFNIILFEKEKLGGLVHNANLIENYLGFPHGITGKELCTIFEKHIKNHNIEIKKEFVYQISFNEDYFTVITKLKKYQTKSILIATGTIPKKIDKDLIESNMKNDVYYEIMDLLPLIKEKQRCCILGGGDAAFDYALNLSRKKIYSTILFKSKKPKCLQLLLDRSNQNEYITFKSNVHIKKILKQPNGKINISYNIENKQFALKTDFLLVAYGRKKNDFLFSTLHEKNNIPGFYFAGDVQNGKYRQIGIAVGQGLHTAMKIDEYLRSQLS